MGSAGSRKPSDRAAGGGQLDLFGEAEEPSPAVRAADPPAGLAELAARMPAEVRLGGSTWSFPGWTGLVYDRKYPETLLAREGLAAYARHPLFRAVGLDRTHYQPLPADALAAYAAQVPADFRFLVKAHEACTLSRYPDRPRYGARRGQPNPHFLDPDYASREVVAPYREGLGGKGGALLFQFAPQELGPPERFAELLGGFLGALPRGPLYAVEVRNPPLLGPAYTAALSEASACHCLNVHPTMPDLAAQARLAAVEKGPALILRWQVRPGYTYGRAGPRFAPFDRIREEDPETRRAVADLAVRAARRGTPVLVAVNNLAEGSAPQSIALLAEAIVERAGRAAD